MYWSRRRVQIFVLTQSLPVWCTRDPGTSLSTGERAGQFSSVERTGKTLPRQLDEPYLLDLASATTVASTAVALATV